MRVYLSAITFDFTDMTRYPRVHMFTNSPLQLHKIRSVILVNVKRANHENRHNLMVGDSHTCGCTTLMLVHIVRRRVHDASRVHEFLRACILGDNALVCLYLYAYVCMSVNVP
jgi:hypothetical protein